MVFGFLKNLLGRGTELMSKIGNNPDFLEALCAGSAYVGAADGDFSDIELNKAIAIIKKNDMIIAGGFTETQINTVMNKMADKTSDRSGKASLLKELTDVAGKPEWAEAVVYIVLDVADQGGIDEAEKTALRTVAKSLGQEKFMETQLGA